MCQFLGTIYLLLYPIGSDLAMAWQKNEASHNERFSQQRLFRLLNRNVGCARASRVSMAIKQRRCSRAKFRSSVEMSARRHCQHPSTVILIQILTMTGTSLVIRKILCIHSINSGLYIMNIIYSEDLDKILKIFRNVQSTE